MMQTIRLATLPLLLCFASCGLIESSSPVEEVGIEEEVSLEHVSQEALEVTEPTGSIEVVWRVPINPVSKFYIHYGSNPKRLSNTITLEIEELEKINDPRQGPVYRYYLTDMPSNAPVYISMVSENSAGKSVASEPILLRKALEGLD